MAFLTGPVNTLTDFQVEYAGLLFGPGTPYGLPPTWSFLDSAPVRTMETQRVYGDGSWAGPDFADVATWQLPVEVMPAAGLDLPTAIAAFVQTVAIAPASRQLWVKLPGFAVRGVNARVAQRSIPIDVGFELGTLAVGAVQWRAPRPVWQSLTRTVTLTPTSGASGLNYPLFTPYSGSGAVLDYGISIAGSSAAVLTNSGNTDAPPVVVVTGPNSSGFQLALDGHLVAYGTALNTGDVVTVDYATGRAMLSSYGSAPVDRTPQLTNRDWSSVPAGGMSTITFASSGGTAAVTVADLWR